VKTITITDETVEFLKSLHETIATQDNRSTAKPIFFTVRKFVNVAVPEGCGDKEMYFDNHDVEQYTLEEAIARAVELEIDFDKYVEDRCHKYDAKEEERYEGFFLTEEGYRKHVKLNGHNIARECNRFDSYVDHVYRNPELESLFKAIEEIGGQLHKKGEV
jgi:hypothetical protein